MDFLVWKDHLTGIQLCHIKSCDIKCIAWKEEYLVKWNCPDWNWLKVLLEMEYLLLTSKWIICYKFQCFQKSVSLVFEDSELQNQFSSYLKVILSFYSINFTLTLILPKTNVVCSDSCLLIFSTLSNLLKIWYTYRWNVKQHGSGLTGVWPRSRLFEKSYYSQLYTDAHKTRAMTIAWLFLWNSHAKKYVFVT